MDAVAREIKDPAGGSGHPGQTPLLGLSTTEFGDLVEAHRRELLVHCYRMLGSIDDAEDAVQDTFVKALRGRRTYQHDISVRAWLYRIATNASLDNLDQRKRRLRDLPVGVGPIPDALVPETTEAGPEARYDQRESISLAFLATLQALPPRQRAVLILRDVLGWRAAEVASLLGMSVAAINSALQRARGTVSQRYGDCGRSIDERVGRATPEHHQLLQRYVGAWEGGDIAGLVALLREDALLVMPPRPSVRGATAIGQFLDGVIWQAGTFRTLEPAAANLAPAFAAYVQRTEGGTREAAALLVLSLDGPFVSRLDAFAEPAIVRRFGPARSSG